MPEPIRGEEFPHVHVRAVHVPRGLAVVLAVLMVAVGGVMLALGMLLLLAFAAGVATLGAGYLLYRRMRRALGIGSRRPAGEDPALDPALEVMTIEPEDESDRRLHGPGER
ncbi:MAG TPA: hypothetical protein VMM18_15535 [Gemmatimonadaceae bacterium]|nr:hypothetical protein [Gemmatimonadaceae bacterium]